jgi:hypothetical protein
MNEVLTYEIVRQALSGFLFVEKSKSIVNQDFRSPSKLRVEIDGEIVSVPVFSCQILIPGSKEKMTVMVAKFGKGEFCCVIHMDGTPWYGLGLDESLAYMSFSIDGKSWQNCSIYLQATFLAGMEQLKEIPHVFEPVEDDREQFAVLKSFLE